MEDTLTIAAIFDAQSTYSKTFRLSDANARIARLKSLKRWIVENKERIRAALQADFKKPEVETDLTEIKPMLTEIDHVCKELPNWMRTKKLFSPLFLWGSRSEIVTEPAGVVLILSPWNFPFNLTVGPIISAIAAGNCLTVKPSEFSPATSELIASMCRELYKPEEVFVVTGESSVAVELVKYPYNHIFFTGSPGVGKLVMKAAAENLSSVTLELGGQNPVILGEKANIADAASKLVLGKSLNAGQSCLAPNYLFVPQKKHDVFIEQFKKQFRKMYGSPETLSKNPDFARIINQKHFERLKSLMDDAVAGGAGIALGGIVEASQNFISPTLFTHLNPDARILREEIFGPLLPVIPYSDKDEVLEFLASKPAPLAFYVFSGSKKEADFFIHRVPSGTAAVNETTLQFIHPELPFGGKNFSGIGKGHGHSGFLAFSNQKSILRQRIGFTTFKLVYPPYTAWVKGIVHVILKWF